MSDFNERIKEKNKQIEKLKGEICKLKLEIGGLQKQNSQYFIGFIKCGNMDYWDEKVFLFDLTTESDVIERLKELASEIHYDECDNQWYYESVSKEEFDKYKRLKALEELEYALNQYVLLPDFRELHDNVKNMVIDLREELFGYFNEVYHLQ